MKINLFFVFLFGLVVYMVIRANRQLAATQAAIQADNPLVAIEPVAVPIATTQPETPFTSQPVNTDQPAVDYLSIYNNA